MQRKELWPWLLAATVLWFALSWYWYVCAIKGFCSIEQWTMSSKIDGVSEVVPIEDREVVSIEGNSQSVTNTVSEEVVEEVVVECSPYLRSYIRYGSANNSADVQRLEQFLNTYEGESLVVDGTFSRVDEAAVKAFQLKYREQVMDPWGMTTPSGYVFRNTRNHVNALHCAYQYAEQN